MLLQNVHNFVDVQHPNCTSMHTASFDSKNCVFFYTCMFMLKQVYFLAAAAGGRDNCIFSLHSACSRSKMLFEHYS